MIKTIRAKEIKTIFSRKLFDCVSAAYLPEEDTYRVFG